MELFLDITLGTGLALAAGVRPFLPLLTAAAFARADFALDFGGTDYSVIEQPAFMLAVIVALIAVILWQRRFGPESLERGALGAAIGGISLGAGALLFAAALADDGFLAWPGIPAGILVAALAQVTVRSLMQRTRARLDAAAQHALTVYLDGVSLLIAVAVILIPPVSIVLVAVFIWLWLTGRKRQASKYAGLRVLK